jgi:hypothetical protein
MRKTLGALTALLLVGAGGAAAGAATFPPGTNGPGLAQVGPISATDGFPVWYKDKTGLRLENCVADDVLCSVRGDVPDPEQPISFPDNYPDEAFYSYVETSMPTARGSALTVISLEQAFSADLPAEGDQVVFARVRLRADLTNGAYTVTTPVSSEKVTITDGRLNTTVDIGVAPGDFSGALGGRIGPFLTWDTFPNDPTLPNTAAGTDAYVGDGVTPHKIKGSAYGTNVFRIEGPGVNPNPAVDACASVAGPLADCVETDLFAVQGKLATNSGVTAQKATYSRSSSDSGVVDVWASSESGSQSILVKDVSTAGAQFSPTGLAGAEGAYFGRIGYAGAGAPTKVQVSNTGDVPATVKTIDVVDRVSGKATYDTDSRVLTVNAVSSDTAVDRTLTVTGYGPLTNGTYVSDHLEAPPVSVTVTSDAKGSASLPVEIVGAGREPITVAAQAGPDQTVSVGQTVTLDGTASVGDIKTFSWQSPDGISLKDPTSATPSFTATAPGEYIFTLTVNGAGGPSSATVKVTVLAVTAAAANAGTDQADVRRGTVVTLNGSASVGAASYRWTQVAQPGDPTVTLAGATTAKPTFTFPLYKAPANNGPLKFALLVTSADGSTSLDEVQVTPSADTVTVASSRYRADKGEWRVDGTSSVLAGQRITIHLGGLDGVVLGTAVVDATGAYSLRTTSATAGTANQVVTVESALGGTATGVTRLG